MSENRISLIIRGENGLQRPPCRNRPKLNSIPVMLQKYTALPNPKPRDKG